MEQESLFGGDPAAPAPGAQAAALSSTAAAVPPEWADLAVDACFGNQKTRWKALEPSAREALLQAMWAYSHAREEALQSPQLAVEAAAALSGWIAAEPQFAAPLRVIHNHLVATSDIPRPPGAATPRAVQGDEQQTNRQERDRG